jgi:methylglutaconyl-CoA hydratase
MDYETLQIDRHRGAVVIWMNRPEMRNAFNEVMIAELAQAVSQAGEDTAARAVLLAARGPAFCAGADLNWMKAVAAFSREQNRADALELARMLDAIHRCPKPVVARVQGDCYAGGLGLVAACDIAIAVREAHFCLSEVKLGLIPATVSPYVLRAIGERLASRYMLTAERFTAEEAHRIGLVQGCVPAEQLDAVIDNILGHFGQASPQALRDAKRLVREFAGRPIDESLIADSAERIADARASDDGKEGVQSFLDKRKPRWLLDG